MSCITIHECNTCGFRYKLDHNMPLALNEETGEYEAVVVPANPYMEDRYANQEYCLNCDSAQNFDETAVGTSTIKDSPLALFISSLSQKKWIKTTELWPKDSEELLTFTRQTQIGLEPYLIENKIIAAPRSIPFSGKWYKVLVHKNTDINQFIDNLEQLDVYAPTCERCNKHDLLEEGGACPRCKVGTVTENQNEIIWF